MQYISLSVGSQGRHVRLPNIRCRGLPTSLESALSRRTDKKLLRDICEDAFQKQDEIHKLEFELLEERSGRVKDRLDNLLQKRSADLLFAQGLLNVRGVLEYLEDECRQTHILKNSNNRQEIWAQILQESANQELVACLARANDKLKRKSSKPLRLEEDISEMYQFASNSVHGKLSPELYRELDKVVYIVEGPLLPKHCQMLICICKHFGFPYMYHQVRTQHEDPRSSSDSE